MSDGRYQRGFAYIIFLIFAAFTFWTACICMLSVLKNGSLKLFPVHIFLIPVIFGVVIQAFSLKLQSPGHLLQYRSRE